jgi:hypothetical protein
MNNKPLYDKAETLWQTLCAVWQASLNGVQIDPKELDKVLKENRPKVEDKIKEPLY